MQNFLMKNPIALVLLLSLLIGTGIGWVLGSAFTPSQASASSSSPGGVKISTSLAPEESTEPGTSTSSDIQVEVKGGGLEALKSFILASRGQNNHFNNYRDMILLSESLSSGDFPEVMAMIEEEGEGRNHQFSHSLFASWLSKDSAAAISWFEQKMSNGDDEGNLAYTLINHLSTIDVNTAISWLDRNPKVQNHDYLLSTITRQMALADPQKALQFVHSRNLNQNALRSAYSTIYQSWASKDPQAALAAAQSLDRADLRQQIYQNIFGQWYQNDPEASLAAIDSLPGDRDRARAYQQIIWHLAEDDPAKAETILQRIPIGQERSQMISNIANQMARNDPQQALEWVERQNDVQGKNWALSNVLSQWARDEPLAALQYAANLPNTSNKENALGSAFNAYIDSEPEAAIQWIQSLDDEFTRSRLLRNQAYSLGRQMPEEALRLADLITPGNDQRNYYRSILGSWSNESPDQAIQWFQTNVTDPELIESLGQTIAGNLVQHDPEKAVAFINQLPANSQDQALSNVVANLSNYDINSAMSLADQIKDEKVRSNAVGNVVSQWARYDPEGVSKWLKVLPVGETRDQSINNFISQIRRHDPEAATIWATDIGDESQRRSAVQRSAQNWLRLDPQAATAWIRSTDTLNDNERENLLKQ